MLGWDLEGIADSVPLEETSTRAVFYDEADDETYTFVGKKFTYDSHGNPTGGLITGITFETGGDVNFTMTGLKLKVTDILGYVQTQDLPGLMEQVMAGKDVVKGSKLGDSLYGLGGDDSVSGGNGADTLLGGAGDDTLVGGSGADHLSGEDGADTFVFASLKDSTKKFADTILDLGADDTIDLSAIDADTTTGGDQAFTLTDAFHHTAGEAVLSFSKGATILSLDVNGDAKADMTILISGDHTDFSNFVP